jgi:pimeloyl-ACP methyl ester carboxylesterase
MNASTLQTHTVVVDELSIRYADSEAADGPVILLTSPWPESLFAFRHVWPDLARTGRLVAVDLGGGGAAYPLEVTGPLADIIAAPGIEVFEGQDIRATVGATVEPVAPRGREPDIWEDYVSAYENGRFAQSTRYVRSYPEQLRVLRDLLPAIRVPVHVFAADGDPLVPVSNGRYLAERIPGSELTILPAGHFAWEEVPDQFAAIVADWVTRAETGNVRSGQ